MQAQDIGFAAIEHDDLDFSFPIMAELGLPLMYDNTYPIEMAVDYDLEYLYIRHLTWKQFSDTQLQSLGLPLSNVYSTWIWKKMKTLSLISFGLIDF